MSVMHWDWVINLEWVPVNFRYRPQTEYDLFWDENRPIFPPLQKSTPSSMSTPLPPTQSQRSIFDLPRDYFDSCHLYRHDGSSSSTSFDSSFQTSIKVVEEKTSIKEEQEQVQETKSSVPRLSCNICKIEFESLLDQRSHFKSDFHRFNVKLSIVGKVSIKEEDFDESTSDSLFRDNDISSISGSEDETERASFLSDDMYKKTGGNVKQKVFLSLRNGELVSFWKCLLMDESETISYDNDKVVFEDHSGSSSNLRENELFERLKYLIHEPRDKSKLRIILLASGGHFAGCVFDGNSVVAHKTFHRYVVRAKAGKKQSSKDASGKAASSAGASLRRYNELALKKEIQDLLASWKPYFDASSCIFVSATSSNRQMLYNGDKAYFSHSNCSVRNVPFTVRRPTFKETKRIYSYLTNIMHEEVIEKRPEPIVKGSDSVLPVSQVKIENLVLDDPPTVSENSEISVSDFTRMSTPLHEASKSGNAEQTLDLLEQGLDPCVLDERGRTPYMLANDKEVRNVFRRFMALNLDKWDWHAAKVPSPLTKEMEESQAAKQAEKDAKRKAKAKELKKLRKAKEKEKAQAQAAIAAQTVKPQARAQSSTGVRLSKEEELKRAKEEEREKRAAAAERRMAMAAAPLVNAPVVGGSSSGGGNGGEDNGLKCSCCEVSLAGKVPFHRYNYKYCSTTCMHVHREMLEDL